MIAAEARSPFHSTIPFTVCLPVRQRLEGKNYISQTPLHLEVRTQGRGELKAARRQGQLPAALAGPALSPTMETPVFPHTQR